MLLYNCKREREFPSRKGEKKMKKRLTPNFKKQFIGLSKREAMALIEESKEEYNIESVDYFETGHKIPQVIYVNFAGMALYFNKNSRRIVAAY